MRRFLRRVPDGGGRNLVIDPATLPGLELYLRSDRGIASADGAPVALWQDQSGNARHAGPSLGTAPTYHTSGIEQSPSGKPGVSFNGLLDGMEGIWPAISTAQGFTAYIVADVYARVNAFGEQVFWEGGGGARPRLNHDFFFAGQEFFTMTDTVFGTRNYGFTQFGYHDFIFVCLPPPGLGGGDNLGYIDGSTTGPSVIDWDWGPPGPVYSLGFAGSRNCKMDLFALLVFSRGHSAGTVAGVRAYLRSQFG